LGEKILKRGRERIEKCERKRRGKMINGKWKSNG
jgi:hypothetical protein